MKRRANNQQQNLADKKTEHKNQPKKPMVFGVDSERVKQKTINDP